MSSGTGGASGGSSATWSYAGGNADGGDDTYSQTKDGGTVSGTLGESGSQTYNTDYNGTAAVVSGAWTQTGTGDANGTDTYNYSYAGSGSGASGGTTWHVTSESGSGSGSFGYDNPLTLSGGTLAGDPTRASHRQHDAGGFLRLQRQQRLQRRRRQDHDAGNNGERASPGRAIAEAAQ